MRGLHRHGNYFSHLPQHTLHHKSMTNQGAFKVAGITTSGNPRQLLPKAENIKKKKKSLANQPDFNLARKQKGSVQPKSYWPAWAPRTCLGPPAETPWWWWPSLWCHPLHFLGTLSVVCNCPVFYRDSCQTDATKKKQKGKSEERPLICATSFIYAQEDMWKAGLFLCCLLRAFLKPCLAPSVWCYARCTDGCPNTLSMEFSNYSYWSTKSSKLHDGSQCQHLFPKPAACWESGSDISRCCNLTRHLNLVSSVYVSQSFSQHPSGNECT